MNTKRFVALSTGLLSSALIIIALITVLIDPLLQYHKPIFGLSPVITDERYQNAGVAKTLDFDNAIIGNSMCENFRPSQFSSVYGGKTAKLTASGSHMYDWQYLLAILKDRGVKNVIMDIGTLEFKASPSESKHYLPIFLYDKNLFNDVNYIFNFDIFNKFTLKMLQKNLKNDIDDYDDVFLWKDDAPNGVFVESFERAPNNDSQESIDEMIETAKNNIKILAPFFKKMKNTTFTFFYCPYSMYYWDGEQRAGMLEKWEKVHEMVFSLLVEYDNVEVHFWTDSEMFSIMSNAENYRDSEHYSYEISELIVNRIKSRKYILTKKDYIMRTRDFFSYLESFDYDSLYS